MKVIRALLGGLQNTLRHIGVVFLLYFFNIIVALSLAVPMFKAFKQGMDTSMGFEELLNRPDYTIIEDFIHQDSGAVISSIIDQAPWMIGVYMFITVFLNGGVIKSLVTKGQESGIGDFFNNCLQYFWRFFRLNIFTLILQGLVVGLTILSIMGGFKFIEESYTNENTYYLVLVIAISIGSIAFSFINMASDYAKVRLVAENTTASLKMLLQSISLTLRHFFSTYLLYLIIGGLMLLFLWVYWKISALISTTSMVLIIALFILQQFFILLRIATRIWNLASIDVMRQMLKPSGGGRGYYV